MALDYNGLEFTPAQGSPWPYSDLEGKVVLMVNTASYCGFTPQYSGLEVLHQQYHDMGFRVLAFPCDQFGQQEPGTDADIVSFCQSQYQVHFPIHHKIEVNGADSLPIYQQLKKEAPGLMGTQRIKWNFTKFLVDRNRVVRKRFAPFTSPQALEAMVRTLLHEGHNGS